jgi:hypothetical protein
MELLSILKSKDGIHKYTATFQLEDGSIKKVSFGAYGYDDFIITNDNKKKQAYLRRHRKREDWNNPLSAGALSRWILWNKPTFEASVSHFIKKFNL